MLSEWFQIALVLIIICVSMVLGFFAAILLLLCILYYTVTGGKGGLEIGIAVFAALGGALGGLCCGITIFQKIFKEKVFFMKIKTMTNKRFNPISHIRKTSAGIEYFGKVKERRKIVMLTIIRLLRF